MSLTDRDYFRAHATATGLPKALSAPLQSRSRQSWHGGSAGVGSAGAGAGHGSTFAVRLPLLAQHEVAAPDVTVQPAANGKPPARA